MHPLNLVTSCRHHPITLAPGAQALEDLIIRHVIIHRPLLLHFLLHRAFSLRQPRFSPSLAAIFINPVSLPIHFIHLSNLIVED
jgi:hypothetical protein